MMSEGLHIENQLLPQSVQQAVVTDQQASTQSLDAALAKVNEHLSSSDHSHDEDLIKALEKLMRVLKQHHNLHYPFLISFRKEAVLALERSYFYLKDYASYSLRLKLLNNVKFLLSKNWERIEDLKLNWKTYWGDVMSLLMREERYDISSAENAMTDFVKGLAAFIMDVRNYFDPYSGSESPSTYGFLVDFAMEKLSDTSIPYCAEGLLLLFSCLPTSYEHYDALLPQFFTLWSAVNHNQEWDYIWLKILARCIKYSKSFDWLNTLPFLLTKLRYLFHLPSNLSTKPMRGHVFPRSIPSYFVHFFLNAKEMIKPSIAKLTKILLKIVGRDLVYDKPAECLSMTLPTKSLEQLQLLELSFLGYFHPPGEQGLNAVKVSSSAYEIAMFIQSLRSYFHPSNNAEFVSYIAQFSLTIVKEVCKTVGHHVAENQLDLPSRSRIEVTHWDSLDYLMGIILSITIEGLYSKHGVTGRIYLTIIKHLLAYNPLYAHALLPLMLYTLDPASCSHSQQTNITIQCLSVCMHTMLYPYPVVLNYLADILRLTLPGLDASDVSKTTITLDLYHNIFSRLGIQYDATQLKYTNITSYKDIATKKVVELQAVSNAVHESQLSASMSYIVDDWVYAMIERVFALVDGLELKVKGVKASPIVGSIALLIGLLFQSLHADMVDLRRAVIDKLLQYILTRAPTHASKICAKIIDVISCNHPAELTRLIKRVTEDIEHMGVEKLAFRLKLLGGCCRFAGCANVVPVLNLLQPILLNKAYLYHDEKAVRKAMGKLIKDVLKGGFSVYPINIKPFYSHTMVLGEPSIPASKELLWHVPVAEEVQKMSSLLQSITDLLVEDIHSILGGKNTTGKKVEELLGCNLKLLTKILRGSADLLGDLLEQTEGESLLYTTRNYIYSTLNQETSGYLKSYRHNMLSLLCRVQEMFSTIPKDSPYYILVNNIFVQKQWCKLLGLIYNRRMVHLKDTDNVGKYFNYARQVSSHSISTYIYKLYRRSQYQLIYTTNNLSNIMSERFKEMLYWKYHNMDTNMVASMVWLREVVRSKQLSYQAIRLQYPLVPYNKVNIMEQGISLTENAYNVALFEEYSENVYIKAVKHLLALSRHEYDAIRPIARKTFMQIDKKLYGIYNVVAYLLLKDLHGTEASYYQLASTLVLLNSKKCRQKISTNINLKYLFLTSIFNVYFNIHTNSTKMEVEKLEKIMFSLSETYSSYATHWYHTTPDKEFFAKFYMKYFATDILSQSSKKNLVCNNGRVHMFYLYNLLHMLGKEVLLYSRTQDLEVIVEHVIDIMSKEHGQSSQSMCVCILFRLVSLLFTFPTYTTTDLIQKMASLLSAQWSALLLGLVRSHPFIEQSNQSSGGGHGSTLSSLLQTSQFLKTTMPRSYLYKFYETNLFSVLFRRDLVLFFYMLLNRGMISVDDMLGLVKVVKDLPVSNEAEKQVINTLTAEICSAVLKYALLLGDGEKAKAVLGSVLIFLIEALEKVSMDYMKDWQEALVFAYDHVYIANPTDDVLMKHILGLFQQQLGGNSAGDGFAYEGKVYMLLSACLQSQYIFTSIAKSSNSTIHGLNKAYSNVSSVIGGYALAEQVAAVLAGGEAESIVHRYMTSRLEFAAIYTSLLQCGIDNTTVNKINQKLVCALHQQSNGMDVEGKEDTEQESLVSACIEQVCMLSGLLLTRQKLSAYLYSSNGAQSILQVFLPVVIQGIVNKDMDVQKVCSEAVKHIISAMQPIYYLPTLANNSYGVVEVYNILSSYAKHGSWKVKESVLRAMTAYLLTLYPVLPADTKKSVKDVFVENILDTSSTEVLNTAEQGMVVYLSYKTEKEMKKIAEAYIRNSETFLLRERNKRKLAKESMQSGTGESKVLDKNYHTTLYMMACTALSSPYDLPSYIPPLLLSFTRHLHVADDLYKALIGRTIQSFKRTHQDRWEVEFKAMFSAEQLEALQGAGAAHYFS